jgi:nucleotide-binding universal stress UspA family protein
MQASPGRPFRVLVAIDFATSAHDSLLRALWLAAEESLGEVHALTVVDPDARSGAERDVVSEALPRLRQVAEEALAMFTHRWGGRRLPGVSTHLSLGGAADQIVDIAADLDVDLVIVGTHARRGAARLLLGSVAEQVVRRAGCPVLVERAKQHAREGRVGIEGTERLEASAGDQLLGAARGR